MAKKPAEVAAMFDAVAPTYDITNTCLSVGQDQLWRLAARKAVDPKPGQTVLDLAAGTGVSSAVYARPGVRVIAADFSEGMLAAGRKKRPQLEFVFADATKLPFGDNEFDTVTISFGLRNVQDTAQAVREMLRVTKPGGKLVICEFSKVKNPIIGPLYRFYLNKLLPTISGWSSRAPEAYGYLSESINAWHSQESLAALVAEAGWTNVTVRNLSLGVVALHIAQKAEAKKDAAN